MKKTLTTLLLVAMAAVSISAHAGSFSRGGSSFSRSSSISSSPSRSMGYSKPAAPSYSAPRPSTSPTYSRQPTYAPPPRTTVINNNSGGGFGGGGGGFMSSMAGGFTGSVLGNLISAPHAAAPAMVAAPAAVAPQMVSPNTAAAIGAPMYVSGGSQTSGWSVFWSLIGWLFTLALLAAVVYGIFWLVRRVLQSRQEREEAEYHSDEPVGDLPFSPVAKFITVQKAFATRDVATLRAHLGEDMIEQAIDDLPKEPGEYTLTAIAYVIQSATRSEISVLFSAIDTSDDTEVRETWHFKKVGSSWLLAGVQQ